MLTRADLACVAAGPRTFLTICTALYRTEGLERLRCRQALMIVTPRVKNGVTSVPAQNILVLLEDF